MIDLINEKLKQVRLAKNALDKMIEEYGNSVSKFKVGDAVKIKRTGRKAKVSRVDIGYSRLSEELDLRIDYGVQVVTGGKVYFKRLMESELEGLK